MHPYLFPWEPTPAPQTFIPHVQRNNEYANDDGGGEDEDRILPRTPDPMRDSMLLYSFDNVAHVIKERPVGPGQHSEDHVAFRMTKATFSEFIRIGFGNYPVNGDTLWGSRASGRYEWHCTHYHRRGPDNKLIIDTASVSYSEPWKQGGGNGTISIELIAASAQTLAYVLAFNLSTQRWTIQGYDINNSQVINITSGPLQQPSNQWLINIPGQMNITISQGSTGFLNNSRFLFNVFRTNDSMGKKSGIAPGNLNFPLNLSIF